MNEKEIVKIVDLFFKYMYNVWDYYECIEIFGDDLGEHIWDKWVNYFHQDCLELWGGLDAHLQEQLINRIMKAYDSLA